MRRRPALWRVEISLPVASRAQSLYCAARRDEAIYDVRVPGWSGIELQHALKARDAAIPLILITRHGDIPMAVKAIKEDAFDFIEKPFGYERLIERTDQIGFGTNSVCRGIELLIDCCRWWTRNEDQAAATDRACATVPSCGFGRADHRHRRCVLPGPDWAHP